MKRLKLLLIAMTLSLIIVSCGSTVDDQTLSESSATSTGTSSDDSGETNSDSDEASFDTDEIAEAIMTTETLVIEAEGQTFYADLEDNSSAEAFRDKLNSDALEVDLHDYGSFEKVGPLPWELPTNDEQITTEPGDVILYQGNQITIYYDVNTWNFTRLAKIKEVTKDDLLEALGGGDVTVRFYLEWSE